MLSTVKDFTLSVAADFAQLITHFLYKPSFTSWFTYTWKKQVKSYSTRLCMKHETKIYSMPVKIHLWAPTQCIVKYSLLLYWCTIEMSLFSCVSELLQSGYMVKPALDFLIKEQAYSLSVCFGSYFTSTLPSPSAIFTFMGFSEVHFIAGSPNVCVNLLFTCKPVLLFRGLVEVSFNNVYFWDHVPVLTQLFKLLLTFGINWMDHWRRNVTAWRTGIWKKENDQ